MVLGLGRWEVGDGEGYVPVVEGEEACEEESEGVQEEPQAVVERVASSESGSRLEL